MSEKLIEYTVEDVSNCGCPSCTCHEKVVKREWCECRHEKSVHDLDDYTLIWKCQYVEDGAFTCICRQYRECN